MNFVTLLKTAVYSDRTTILCINNIYKYWLVLELGYIYLSTNLIQSFWAFKLHNNTLVLIHL